MNAIPQKDTRTQIEFLSHANRDRIVDLLAAQLSEHSITTKKKAIAHAVDGLLEKPERGAILALRYQQEIVGVSYIAYTWTAEHGGKTCWLEEIYVVPQYRSQGLGQILLQATLDFAIQSKCNAIDLEIEADHKKVESLYLRNGFKKHTRSRWVKYFVSKEDM